MKKEVYNIGLLLGTILVTGGTAMISIPYALISLGGIIIILTYLGAKLNVR